MTSFEERFLGLYGSLKSFTSRYLRRPEDIEDIVQETFVHAYQANQKTHIKNLKGYLFTVARNLSLNHQALHTHKMTDYLEELGISDVFDSSASIESQIESKEEFHFLCEAIRELSPQCQKVLIFKRIYGLSHSEIAARLGITVSTTNKHLAKAINSCTEYMHKLGYSVSGRVVSEQESSYGQR